MSDTQMNFSDIRIQKLLIDLLLLNHVAIEQLIPKPKPVNNRQNLSNQ